MDKIALIQTQTQELINKMVDQAVVEVTEEAGMFHVSIKTDDDAPTVIGRHGETIRALQKILEVIVFKETGEKADLLINVNDYREKQIERLEYIADQAAEKVQERQSATYLRGFSSYERRIMHEYVGKSHPTLTSYSIGEGRDRRLVLDIARDTDRKDEAQEPQPEEDDIQIEV